MLGRKIAVPKSFRQLLCGLIGERLGLGQAAGRPAPHQKIAAADASPELREVHGAKMRFPMKDSKSIRR